jgi:hypothetical protein
VYTDWFPASAVAVIFDLEADRISWVLILALLKAKEVLY